MRFEQMQRDNAVLDCERSDRLRRSRSGATVPEISSGWALNELFDEIMRSHAASPLRGPLVPLDPEVVAHINFAGGVSSGGGGLLKAGKPLDWPAALAQDAFKDQRAQVEKGSPVATAQAK